MLDSWRERAAEEPVAQPPATPLLGQTPVRRVAQQPKAAPCTGDSMLDRIFTNICFLRLSEEWLLVGLTTT